MSQERLNELTILSIEQDLLENIEYKSLISNLVAQTDEPCVEIFFDDFYIYFLYKASFFLDRPRPHNSQGRPWCTPNDLNPNSLPLSFSTFWCCFSLI
jgi:hypothetical protein